MTISNKAAEAIGRDKTALLELGLMFNKTEGTIRRWVHKRHVMLVTPDAIRLIKSKTGMSQSEIISEK